MDEDKETVELQSLMEVVPDEEEVAIDVVPLATKPPTIGRIVGIKRLLEVTAVKVRVTAAKQNLLMLLVYKLLLLVFRVNVAGTKLQLLTELQLLKDYNCLKDKDFLKIKITYEDKYELSIE
ncbi:hypothetical protein Tco_1470101 [Tanacetum coccineum]